LRIAAIAAGLILLVGVVTPVLFSRSYLDVARRHLASADPMVRADTAGTLARELATPEQLAAEDRGPAIALLLGQLAGDDPGVQEQVLDFLSQHGNEGDISDGVDPTTLETIQDLASDNQHPGRRDAAIRALGAIHKPGVAAYLTTRLQAESNPAIRLKLVRALGDQGSVHAIGPLMNLVAHDPLCRAEAQAALDRTFSQRRLSLFGGQDAQIKHALQGLSDAMAVHDRQLQEAMGGDVAPGPSGESYPGPYGPYQRVLDQGAEEEQIQAVHELRRTGETDTVSILLDLLGHDSRYVGAAAAMAIAELDPLGAGDALRTRLDSPSATVRRDAALALGFSHQRQHVDPLLVALAEEPVLDTAEEMVFALGELQSPDARAGLVEAARRHPQLRAGVDAALARLPD
jgi:HEAT repeat protein